MPLETLPRVFSSGRILPMKIPYMDLSIKNLEERQELLSAIDKVFQHGRIILGPEIIELETSVAKYCQVKDSVGVSSGTSAVNLALTALDIKAGDEVIVPALSWIASANAIAATGAKPIFVDIREDLNIDPVAIEKAITNKTKAILPVHFMGKLCDIPAILKIANQYQLHVVEDSAQSFGATFEGKVAGSFGIMGCFSMNAMKVFAGLGDSGMITSNDTELTEKIRILRYCGMVDKIESHYLGLNAKMDTVQAAILLVRLKKLNALIEKRRKIAKNFDNELKGIAKIPIEKAGYKDVYYGYTLQVANRDKFRKYLDEQGIETKVQHWPLMPDQPTYAHCRNDFYPNAKKIVNEIVNIPNHENLTEIEQTYILDKVKSYFHANT